MIQKLHGAIATLLSLVFISWPASYEAQAQQLVRVLIQFPEYSADVVGRDLSSGVFKGLGHVGLYSLEHNKILEVLNKPNVVQMNTFASFFKAEGHSGYWGARYQKYYGEPQVIVEGWWQRIFEPSYTLTARWQEGKWIPRLVPDGRGGWKQNGWNIQKAIFRCDTFVAYSYYRAFKNMANLFVNPMFPNSVFRSLPFRRPLSIFDIPRSWL